MTRCDDATGSRALKPRLARAAAVLSLLAAAAGAQDYPAKPVRVVVPYPPGGGTDAVARLVMPKLGEAMGASFLVENRSGSGGTLGTEMVAKSAADGYTLVIVNVSHAVNPTVYRKLAYDSVYDFAPITLLASGSALLVVHPSVQAKTVKELIALAKARAGKLHYASAGNGTPPHLAAELFKLLAGVNMVHVPYKGNAQALSDVVSGKMSVSFPPLAQALPLVRTDRLRALAVTGARRSPVAPDLPTIAEAGVRGYESSLWYGLLAPAGTSSDIPARLSREAAPVLQLPEIRDRLREQGLEPVGGKPEEFIKLLNAEIAKWRKVVAASGAKME